MNRLFIRNDAKYRLLRTIIQGIIGVIIANLDYIVGVFSIPVGTKALIVALVMAILSPIMAAMGTKEMPEKDDVPHGYFEEERDDGDTNFRHCTILQRR